MLKLNKMTRKKGMFNLLFLICVGSCVTDKLLICKKDYEIGSSNKLRFDGSRKH